jgi:hypothetical protein
MVELGIDAGAELAGADGPPFAATTTMETTTAAPAITHGKLKEPFERDNESVGAPHSWQNRAPGDSVTWQFAHSFPRSAAPQL